MQLEGGVLALQWIDKRPVNMLSTIHDRSLISKQWQSRNAPSGIEEVLKPRMGEEYSKHMGGVDKADQLLSYYGFCHCTVKWWRWLFFSFTWSFSCECIHLVLWKQPSMLPHDTWVIPLTVGIRNAHEVWLAVTQHTPAPVSSTTSTSHRNAFSR